MEAAGSRDPDDDPPEADRLVDKEDENLAEDGKPSEVSKKLIKGSEAEEVPEVPEAVPDKAHSEE